MSRRGGLDGHQKALVHDEGTETVCEEQLGGLGALVLVSLLLRQLLGCFQR